MEWDSIAVGLKGTAWVRPYAYRFMAPPAPWEAVECEIVEVSDLRSEGLGIALYVVMPKSFLADGVTSRRHKVFHPKGQKAPGAWRNMLYDAKQHGAVVVRFDDKTPQRRGGRE